jgi:hypothetical protein
MNKILQSRQQLIAAMNYVLSNDLTKANLYPGNRDSYLEALVRQHKDKFQSIVDEVVADRNKHFLSISNESRYMVSYSRKKDDTLSESKRIKTTLQKYFVKQLHYGGVNTAHLLDQFVNHFWKVVMRSIDIESEVNFLEGDEITKHYTFTKNRSCMTGLSAWKTAIYAANPNTVKLLLWEDLRALFWKTDEDVKVLDNIYPANHPKTSILQEWALKKGFVIPVRDADAPSYHHHLSDGEVHSVTLKRSYKDGMDIYPFIDTFMYATPLANDHVRLSTSVKGCKICCDTTSGYARKIFVCTACHQLIDDNVYSPSDANKIYLTDGYRPSIIIKDDYFHGDCYKIKAK